MNREEFVNNLSAMFGIFGYISSYEYGFEVLHFKEIISEKYKHHALSINISHEEKRIYFYLRSRHIAYDHRFVYYLPYRDECTKLNKYGCRKITDKDSQEKKLGLPKKHIVSY